MTRGSRSDGDFQNALEMLRRVSRALASSPRLRDGAPEVLRELCQGLSAGGAVLWAVDEQTSVLRPVTMWPPPSEGSRSGRDSGGPVNPWTSLGPGIGVAGRAWASGGPLSSDSLPVEDRLRDSLSQELAGELGIPVIGAEGTVGVLELLTAEPRPLGSFPLEALEGVADQLAQLLHRDGVERRLRESEVRYRTLVEQIPAITYTDAIDDALSTLYISPQIETLLGITPEEYIADPDLWFKHLHPEDRDDAMRRYLEGRDGGGPFSFEYRMIARDGRVVWFRDDAIVLRDESGRPAVVHGVMLDVTDRKQAEEEVEYLAYHDKLTGLPNRAMFEEFLGLAMARARRHGLGVAVLYMDLDNFKLVNDSLGHEAGDELLRQITGRLRDATRETDLVARQGGDEFLLLLADLELSADELPKGASKSELVAESVANRIHRSFEEPFVVAGTECFVSASLGGSIYPLDATDSRTLLKNADLAMYQSKRSGPGGCVVFANESADSLTKLSLTTRLRKAVSRQQWILHYQPIVDLRDGDMLGVEALVRWSDPNGGIVPPGEFIPLAEEMGLIEAIGDWVMEELCRQAAAWRAEGIDLDISFNLSPRQVWQPALVAKVMHNVQLAGLDPNRVVIEITESTAMADPDRTQRILNDLHDQGIRLAIDDFGTGHSSLARLKHLPVDILKIDQYFVRDIPHDPDVGSMVTAIIQLAQSLGMQPLAEGIETEGQWAFLVDRGCTVGQGYHFSRPVTGEEISMQLDSGRYPMLIRSGTEG